MDNDDWSDNLLNPPSQDSIANNIVTENLASMGFTTQQLQSAYELNGQQWCLTFAGTGAAIALNICQGEENCSQQAVCSEWESGQS